MKNLENLTIHQFRGLRDLKLENLGRINLLVGRNNSGKTSVLEAISTYCRPLDLREWLITAQQREERSLSTSNLIDALFWLFPRQKPPNVHLSGIEDLYNSEILISGNGNFPIREVQATYQVIESIQVSSKSNMEINEQTPIATEIYQPFEMQQGVELTLKVKVREKQQNLFDTTEISEIIEGFQLWESERIPSKRGRKELKISVATITPVSHRTESKTINTLWTDARIANLASEVINLLKQVDEEIIGIEILTPYNPNKPVAYLQHQKLGLAPFTAFGDGVRRTILIALTLANIQGGILLIDEIETAIHTEALQSIFLWLVKWSRKMDVQIFATTHSLEAVDALLEATEAESDLVLYRLEQKESETRIVRHDWDRLNRLREELGQEVRW